MSDVSDEIAEGDVTVRIVLYPDDGPEKAIRQLGYGMTPFLLIEPDYDEDTGDTTWTVTGSWVDDHDELLGFMEAALDVVRAAVEQGNPPAESKAGESRG